MSKGLSLGVAEAVKASLMKLSNEEGKIAAGYECGISLQKFNDIKEGDVLEAFIMEEVARD